MRQKILQVYKQMSINKLLIQKKILPITEVLAFQFVDKRKETEKICTKLLIQLNYSCGQNLSGLSINKNN